MSAKVDLHFCDLCGLSIPQKDLDSGLARVIDGNGNGNGKTVGVCCLSLILEPSKHSGEPLKSQAVRPPSIGKPGFQSGGGQTVAGKGVGHSSAPSLFPTAVLLVALAGAAAFLEWRSAARSGRSRTAIQTLATKVELTQKSLDQVDAKVTAIPTKSIEAKLLTLQSETDRIGLVIAAIKPADDSQVQSRIRQLGLRLEDLAGRFAALEAGQGALGRSVQGGFENLTKELASLGVRGTGPSARSVDVMPSGKGADSSGDPTLVLPDDLAKEVARLSDAEPGVRWAAIDVLLSKKDTRVVPYLLPTLKDEDPFIRRLTATGLGKLEDERAIWPLFEAMSDSESIVRSAAYRSLVKITKDFGKPLAFDPDARKDKRSLALKKWQTWLEKRMKR